MTLKELESLYNQEPHMHCVRKVLINVCILLNWSHKKLKDEVQIGILLLAVTMLEHTKLEK